MKIAYDALKTLISTHINDKSNPHKVTTTQIGAVSVTRTINGKSLTDDVVLTSEDIGINIDATLTIDGAVADAKSTGDTINNIDIKVSELDSSVQEIQDYITQLTYIEEVGF